MNQQITFEDKQTERSFERFEFMDGYRNRCSLQQSSVIGDYGDAFDRPGTSAVWLGVDIPFDGSRGAPARMHLSREHVAALLPLLQRWLETGSFKTL